MTETAFMNAVVIALQARYRGDIYLERRNVGMALVRNAVGHVLRAFHASRVPGAADYFGHYEGRHFEIEFKAAKGRLSDDQKHFLATQDRKGAETFVWQHNARVSLDENIRRCLRDFADAFE